jgi:hypothetical protein
VFRLAPLYESLRTSKNMSMRSLLVAIFILCWVLTLAILSESVLIPVGEAAEMIYLERTGHYRMSDFMELVLFLVVFGPSLFVISWIYMKVWVFLMGEE